jgi:hypothetical protein
LTEGTRCERDGRHKRGGDQQQRRALHAANPLTQIAITLLLALVP